MTGVRLRPLWPRLWLVLLLSGAWVGCTHDAPPAPPAARGAGRPAASGLRDHDPALAKRLVAAGAVLLDVRTRGEFDERHLPKATLIGVQELAGRMAEIDKLTGGNRDQAIVVYCRSGHRAAQAKQMLLDAGYRRVTNLGGIDDWPAD